MPQPAPRRRLAWLASLAVLIAAGGTLGFTLQAPHDAHPAAHSMPGMPGMSDFEMQEQIAAWYAAHPAHGAQITTDTPSATFTAAGFQFNADNDAGTQIDTVKVFAGQWVQWQWGSGTHTVTSGTSSDPTPGTLFNVPLNSSTTSFMFRFDATGTVPFYCVFHDLESMRGAVTVAAPADTFLATGFIFNADHNTATAQDTVHIHAGQAVMFKWKDGIHTTINGTGAADPNAGTLWTHNLTSSDSVFTFTFDNAGTFPFFCSIHESFGMKGVVVVSAVTAVGPTARGIGFVSNPAPNPSQAGVTFRFALPREGQARAEVIDAQGRRVATLVDERLTAGTYAARWDGRANGARAAAGIYYVRLTLPGFTGAKRVAIVR
jgi:plastocyanin